MQALLVEFFTPPQPHQDVIACYAYGGTQAVLHRASIFIDKNSDIEPPEVGQIFICADGVLEYRKKTNGTCGFVRLKAAFWLGQINTPAAQAFFAFAKKWRAPLLVASLPNIGTGGHVLIPVRALRKTVEACYPGKMMIISPARQKQLFNKGDTILLRGREALTFDGERFQYLPPHDARKAKAFLAERKDKD